MLGSKFGLILSGRARETIENTTESHLDNTDIWKTDTQETTFLITPCETKFRRFLEVRNYRN